VTQPAPAETLRAAAEKLRTLANEATAGPWTATPRYRKGTQIVVQYDVRKPPLPGSNVPQENHVHPSRAGDALYGVAMQPAVGLAIADWLDATAADATPCRCVSCPTQAALALARVLLGEGAQR
jgi:hypothetical protein